MNITQTITSVTLAGLLTYEQIIAYGDEHLDPETNCPEPGHVREFGSATNTTTTTTTAPPQLIPAGLRWTN